MVPITTIIDICIIWFKYILRKVRDGMSDPVDAPIHCLFRCSQRLLGFDRGQVQPIVQRLWCSGPPIPLSLRPASGSKERVVLVIVCAIVIVVIAIVTKLSGEEGIELLIRIPVGSPVRVRRVGVGLLLVHGLLVLIIVVIRLGTSSTVVSVLILLLLPILILLLLLIGIIVIPRLLAALAASTSAASCTCTSTLLPLLPQAGIVLLPPFVIAQRFKRLVDQRELLGGLLLIGVGLVLVGMPPEGQLAILLLDGFGVRLGIDLEDVVVAAAAVVGGEDGRDEEKGRGEDRPEEDGEECRGVPPLCHCW